MNLYDVTEPGEKVLFIGFSDKMSSPQRKRLLAMGFIPHLTKIEYIRRPPMGDTLLVNVRGTNLKIVKELAENLICDTL